MKKNILVLIFIQLLFSQSFSGFSFSGAKSMGTAGAVVSNINDSESVFYNPSGLANSNKYSAIFGKSKLYELKFLTHEFISISFPNKMAFSFQQLSTDSKGSFSSESSSPVNLSIDKVEFASFRRLIP